jgi:hypothetical protein
MICEGNIDTKQSKKKKGVKTGTTLNAITALMNLDPVESRKIQKEQTRIKFICFDILYLDGKDKYHAWDISKEKLAIRKVMLREVIHHVSNISESFVENKVYGEDQNQEEVFQTIVGDGKEGVIYKKEDEPYDFSGGRRRNNWIKRKRNVSMNGDIDAFIIGYEPAKKGSKFQKENLIGAVRFATYIRNREGAWERTWIGTVGAMPLELRRDMSDVVMSEEGIPIVILKDKYIRKVFTITGQDVSPVNHRFVHCTANWANPRTDKEDVDCQMEAGFLESQIL